MTETLFCRYFVATCSWIVTATFVQHSVSLLEFKKDRIYQSRYGLNNLLLSFRFGLGRDRDGCGKYIRLGN